MKKSLIKIVPIILFALGSFTMTSQNKRMQKADEKYNQFAYADASELYLSLVEKGITSGDIYLKLGNSLYFNAKYKEASKWYAKFYAQKKGHNDLLFLLRYAQSLQAIGNKTEGQKIYADFAKLAKASNSSAKTVEDHITMIELNSDRYHMNSLTINSPYIDFGSFYRNDTLYFSSSRNRRAINNRIDAWNNDRFLDLYSSYYNETEGDFTTPERMKGDINSKFHESSAIITKDGNTMYFTRSSDQATDDSKTHLKIYRAFKINGRWSNFEDLSINQNNFSNAHPALSPDEKTLFFVSNMPGSLGETDIYSVEIYDNGSLGKPKNMGSLINTSGRESFPFVSAENELYFSSDGHFGLGGYDVFYIDLEADTNLVLNVGTPINSPQDDFAFSVLKPNQKGFMSSNRTGIDNIYKVKELKSIKDNLYIEISGIVRDKDSDSPISNSSIAITDERGKVVANTFSDDQGSFQTTINQFMRHHIKASKNEYLSDSLLIPIRKEHTIVQLRLKKEEIEKIVPITFNTTIYYDFNKTNIRSKETVTLDKVVTILNDNPTVRIRISSHSDSRGSAKYNQLLSEKRTEQVIQYFVKRGIDASRMVGESFGESQPINDCRDGKKCSKSQHQLNRRTEISVLNN